MLARCQPWCNNALTRTHECACAHARAQPPQLDDPGSKSKDLSVTGHHWRVGIYTGCGSLCTLICARVCVCACAHAQRQKEDGLGQCHVWTALSLTQRSEQGPHVDFICYRNKRREFKGSNVECTYFDLCVSIIFTKPFTDLKRGEKTSVFDSRQNVSYSKKYNSPMFIRILTKIKLIQKIYKSR